MVYSLAYSQPLVSLLFISFRSNESEENRKLKGVGYMRLANGLVLIISIPIIIYTVCYFTNLYYVMPTIIATCSN